MQPYFLPYLGYLRLLSEVDIWVVYDDVKFSKGWSNRNWFLGSSGVNTRFTAPVKVPSSRSNYRDVEFVRDGVQSKTFDAAIERLSSHLGSNICSEAGEVLRRMVSLDSSKLVQINVLGVVKTMQVCGLRTPSRIAYSSELGGHFLTSLSSTDRVVAICKMLGAEQYINLPGGRTLYRSEDFFRKGIGLAFIDPVVNPLPTSGYFESSLSILARLGPEGVSREIKEGFHLNGS